MDYMLMRLNLLDVLNLIGQCMYTNLTSYDLLTQGNVRYIWFPQLWNKDGLQYKINLWLEQITPGKAEFTDSNKSGTQDILYSGRIGS